MNLTSTEIFKLVWDRIRDSLLGKTVPMMYADHYPNNPSGEFIVVGSLSNVVGDSQVATVNVNIMYRTQHRQSVVKSNATPIATV